MVIGILISLAADLENRFAVPVVGRIQPGYAHLHSMVTYAFHCSSNLVQIHLELWLQLGSIQNWADVAWTVGYDNLHVLNITWVQVDLGHGDCLKGVIIIVLFAYFMG